MAEVDKIKVESRKSEEARKITKKDVTKNP
jgi:hypothetical protein